MGDETINLEAARAPESHVEGAVEIVDPAVNAG
jgi:hypothetical protein